METYPFYFTWTSQENKTSIAWNNIQEFTFQNENIETIDLASISYQASFGLKNKQIQESMKKQIDGFCMASPKAIYKQKEKVTNNLLNLINLDKDGKIFYTLSGAESIENAIKMSRLVSGKKLIGSRKNSYHGASLGALSIGGDWRTDACLTYNDWNFRVPEPHLDPDAKELIKIATEIGTENISALCFETITGGNGVWIPTETWYQNVQKFCNQNSIHLILDEVVCGFYRTGKAFGFQHYKNLSPDFVCMAKGISGGFFPLGAVYTNNKVSQFFEKNTLACGLTNYAHPIGLATLEAVLKYTEHLDFQNQLKENQIVFSKFQQSLQELDTVKEVRSIGMLMAIETNKELKLTDFLNQGIHLGIQKNTLILAPFLNFDLKIFELALTKLISILEN